MSLVNLPSHNALKHVHLTECDVLMVLALTTHFSAPHLKLVLLANQFCVGMVPVPNMVANALILKLVPARELHAQVALVQRISHNVQL
jgi:hypothetical protein